VPCHIAEHQIWARQGLNAAVPSVAVVVRRLALFCGLHGLDDLADELGVVADELGTLEQSQVAA
jgi:hypothetical protein